MLIAVIVIGGSYFRFVDLDRDHFNGDELDHYYAAQSLASGQGPLLPSGNAYIRGIDVTRLVSLTLESGDSAEASARLPSAVFGIMNLIIFAAVAWLMAGAWPAVWATLLLAIYPEAIVQSRMTRFYTYQLNFGLLALFTGWRALSTTGERASPSRANLVSSYLWAAATVLLLALAARVQVTTYSIVLGWAACVALAGLADLIARGRKAWRDSFSMQVTALLVGGPLILIVGFPGAIRQNLASSQFVPAWSGVGHPLAYYYRLSELFPLMISLLPVAFLAAVLRNARLGVYLAIWFSVPILIHSLLLPWKGERYILLALPAVFLLTGMAAASCWGALNRWLTGAAASAPRLPLRIRRWGPPVGLATIAAFALITQHAFNEARRIPAIPKPINWRAAGAILEGVPGHENIPVGTSIALPAMYYWERADFVVGTDFLEAPSSTSFQKRLLQEGASDWYGGIPVLVRPSAIRSRFASAGEVIIGIDSDRWHWNNIDAELREALTREAEELCKGRCGDFLLFHWRLDNSQPRS